MLSSDGVPMIIPFLSTFSVFLNIALNLLEIAALIVFIRAGLKLIKYLAIKIESEKKMLP